MSEKKLDQALDIFGEEIANEIARLLKKEDKVASGDLIKSISTEVIKTAKGSQFRIIAEEYYKYVDEGRKKGSMPPIRAISRWVKLKGISEDAIWPIAIGIRENGIRATNITEKTITNISRMKAYNQFEEDLMDWVEEEIADYINSIPGFIVK